MPYTKVVGAAKMGLAPGKPAPLESRASRDFSVTSRSDIKVLERFAGMWDGSLKMDDFRGVVKVRFQVPILNTSERIKPQAVAPLNE